MNVRAYFRLIVLLSPLVPGTIWAQSNAVPYGDHPTAGQYLRVGDAEIYYERYGSGPMLLLLHGGLFGYIDEFAQLIPILEQDHTVIAVALRGHGRSGIGAAPLSHRRFAEDAAALLRHLSAGPADVIGFSTGAIAAYLLASSHPQLVRSLVAIGGPIAAAGWTEEGLREARTYSTPEELERQYPALVAARKQRYRNPADWDRLVREFATITNEPDIPDETMRSIVQPTLIVAGDRDHYTKAEHFVQIYRLLPSGSLAFVPACGHVVLSCNPGLMQNLVTDFLKRR